jgi:hypothetical protein
VRQPLRCHPFSHSSTPRRTYWLSVTIATIGDSAVSRSASMAARSSMRLFVVRRSPPPASTTRPSGNSMCTPQPPGPGFPMQEPSV